MLIHDGTSHGQPPGYNEGDVRQEHPFLALVLWKGIAYALQRNHAHRDNY